MSRSDDVVDGVKQMILDGRLQAGQRLPAEKELAATLGVSRGSLREGVHALGTLGILESRHGDGTYVTTLDPALLLAPVGFVAELQDDAAAFHTVRRLLETEAAGLAALHIDDDCARPPARRRSTRPRARWSSSRSTTTGSSTRTWPSTRRSPGRPATPCSPRSSWASPGGRPGPGCGAGSATRARRTGRSSSTRRSSRPSPPATPTGRACGWRPTCSGWRTRRRASGRPLGRRSALAPPASSRAARPASGRASAGARRTASARASSVAAMPMSTSGIRTVVSAGTTSRRVEMSSKPGERHVLRHPDPGLAAGGERAERHDVVDREHELGQLAAAQQGAHRVLAALVRERARDHRVVRHRAAQLGERPAERVAPLARRQVVGRARPGSRTGGTRGRAAPWPGPRRPARCRPRCCRRPGSAAR